MDLESVKSEGEKQILYANAHIWNLSFNFILSFKMMCIWEFPGGTVVRILGFHCRGLDSIPGWGIEIL